MNVGFQTALLNWYAPWSVQAFELNASPFRSAAYSTSKERSGAAANGAVYARTLNTSRASRPGLSSGCALKWRYVAPSIVLSSFPVANS